MLNEGEIHPELIARVVDRVASELTAAAALADGNSALTKPGFSGGAPARR